MCDYKKYYLEKIKPKHNLNWGNKRPKWFKEFIETTKWRTVELRQL